MKINLNRIERVNLRNALERMQQKQREAKQSEIEINELINDIAGGHVDASDYKWKIDSQECQYIEGEIIESKE